MEERYIEIANQVVNRSGEVIRSYFRQPLEIIDKGDMSPVTVADRETEKAMREELTRLCATHSVTGEELDSLMQESHYTWVLDPIDGTKSFISGVPLFGTLLCLCLAKEPQLGVIDMPILRERWIGKRGQGTTCNEEVCSVSATTKLNQARLFCTEYGPDSMLSGSAAVDFGTRKRAGTATGFVNGCGSIGAVLGGLLPGYFDSETVFMGFAAATFLAGVLLIPFWNLTPKGTEDEDENTKLSTA